MATRNDFNETKYLILKCLRNNSLNGQRHLSPREISNICNISLQNAKSQLTRLFAWHYIWRADNAGRGRHFYTYSTLKPKGFRVLDELRVRKILSKESGIDVSLNLKKYIPIELKDQEIEIRKRLGTDIDECRIN